MCLEAINSKLELLKQFETVLQGSVKMSEYRLHFRVIGPEAECELSSDNTMLDSRALPTTDSRSARNGSSKNVRKKKVQPPRGHRGERLHSVCRWYVVPDRREMARGHFG